MEVLEIVVNIFTIIFGIGSIISIIILLLEFKRSNQIRTLNKYQTILDKIFDELDNLCNKNVSHDERNIIHNCKRFVILLKFNLKLNDMSKFNISLSKILEAIFRSKEEINLDLIKIIERELNDLLDKFK